MSEAQDIRSWVDTAPGAQTEFRQAVHIILTSITRSTFLRSEMVMKGGILMAIRYQSPRFTTDIDFSSRSPLRQGGVEEIRREMESQLATVSHLLEYGMDCRIQSCAINPRNRPDATFPSIELKIGYAYRGTARHKRLLNGQSPSSISIDFSLNETILALDEIPFGGGTSLRTYALTDLMAEKLRSLLQQVPRNRYRRQDVFDLCKLMEQPLGEDERAAILKSLMEKSTARNITPGPGSLADEEVRRRAKKDYQTLADEVEGELPDFDSSYDRLLGFYGSLPWQE